MNRNHIEIWDSVLSIIRPQLNEQSFNTWFDPLRPVSIADKTLTLEIPSKFFSEWIDEHYRNIMYDALEEIIDPDAKVVYRVNNGNGNGNSSVSVKDQDQRTIIPGDSSYRMKREIAQLNPQYTFDTFVEGPSNQFAHAVAYAVAEQPGKTNFNPLLIWGGVGLGKTHLAQAIGVYALENKRVKEISYTWAKQFMVDFINSVRNNKREEFTNRFDKVDLLIVDDIEAFINKTETQMEFFHIFNTLHQRGKQIVLTSDRPPRDFSGEIQERLTSRFQNGLVVDIKPPDLETRVAILQKKAADVAVELDPEVALLLATHISRNIRELQGALNSLLAYASVYKTSVDMQLAKRVLKELKYYESKPLSIEDIQISVSDHYSINANLLREKTRKKEIVLPRQIAMYLVKEMTNHSLKTIGLHFGGRDHSTVLHAVNQVEMMIEQNDSVSEVVASIKQRMNYKSD